jgi:hypothetical protein
MGLRRSEPHEPTRKLLCPTRLHPLALTPHRACGAELNMLSATAPLPTHVLTRGECRVRGTWAAMVCSCSRGSVSKPQTTLASFENTHCPSCTGAPTLGHSCVHWPAHLLEHALPHLHRDWACPRHICTGTKLAPATSAPGLSLPLPHLHRDWACPRHICTGTGGLAPWHICTHWRDLTVVQAAAVEQLVGAFGGGAARRAELSAVDVGSGGSPRYRRVPFQGTDNAAESTRNAVNDAVERSRAEPSRAEPSRAEPSRAEPSRAEPSRAEPSRAEPSRAEPGAADAGSGGPERLSVQHARASVCAAGHGWRREGPQVRTRQSFR